MFINWKRRELNLKIVYYGPAMSGKTTNLQIIHSRINPQIRGDLVSLKTRGDRTIFFDFLQLELGQVKGLKPKFNLYTVPGQIIYAASRKLVLQGADGVVFVVDSQTSRLVDNVYSFRTMRKHLAELGLDPRRVPCVIQFNKRDLPDIAPVPALQRYFCAHGNDMPTFESIAIQGIGVFETLKAAIKLVMAQTQQQL
ncbi:MAG: gliding-motility protein MglA [Chloroflexi bacterium]|nr:MAG: gliding-motility protein MglA [Chloroflexota bacterium]